MKNINLLPGNLSSSKPLMALLFKVKIFNLIAVIIYGIFLAVVITISISNSASITFSNKKVDDLRSNLTSLSQVEKQYFFLKYKTDNIKKILAKQSSLPGIQKFESVYSESLKGTDLKTVGFANEQTTIEVVFKDSDSLKNFLELVKNSPEYIHVQLDTISYRPGNGYSVYVKIDMEKTI